MNGHNRKISTIVKDQYLVKLRPTDTVQAACLRMCEQGVGAVLVTDSLRHLKGIFTGRDAVRLISTGNNPAATLLEDAMTRDPDVVAPDQKAVEALQMMCDGGYRHLPVIEDGKVVGVLSRRDFKGLELDKFEDRQSLWERIC